MAGHGTGDPFALLQPGTLRAIPLGQAAAGSTVSVGSADGSASASVLVTGESLRPPSPVKLDASLTSSGSVEIRWVRRSRLGWAWLDEMDAPIGEMREQYRVRLVGQLGTVELETVVPHAMVSAPSIAGVGPGAATISVQQIGDRAISRAAVANLVLP
jgi:hypothetical protein